MTCRAHNRSQPVFRVQSCSDQPSELATCTHFTHTQYCGRKSTRKSRGASNLVIYEVRLCKLTAQAQSLGLWGHKIRRLVSFSCGLMSEYHVGCTGQVVNIEQLKQRFSVSVIIGIQRWTENWLTARYMSCCERNAREHLLTEASGVELHFSGLFL
jgi:hypothetical protein